MRRVIAILIIAALVAPAGLATGQVPTLWRSQPRDLIAEFYDFTGPITDPNGLPPATNLTPSLILDAKSRYYAVFGDLSYYNERYVRLLFADPETGERTRTFLLPGVYWFHAWYGDWQDKDGDKLIDTTSNAANEWTARIDQNDTMRGYIWPGYYPDAASDYWLLGQWLVTNTTALEKTADFEFTHDGGGNWSANFLVPVTDGSLLEEKWMATVANGIVAPSTERGYACGTHPACLIDEDRYDVLDQNVAQLYSDVIDTTNQVVGDGADAVFGITDPITDPILNPIVSAGIDALIAGIDLAYGAFLPTQRGKYNETDPSDPYASMTAAHGATRATGGYDFASGPHAWMNLVPWNYYTVAPGATLASAPLHVPDAQTLKGKGLAPHFIGIQGLTGVFYDKNANHAINAGEFEGVCNIIETATGAAKNITATLRPVDDLGNPTTWGPAGAYVLEDSGPAFTAAGEEVDAFYWDDAVLDLADGQVHRHYTTGPITVELNCDQADPGDWFAQEVVYLPLGTYGFNIVVESATGLAIRFLDPLNNEVTEAVRDVDFYADWA